MILMNATPDDVEWMHVGVTGVIKAGQEIEFDNARGNHIANKFGRRGIVQLQYNDSEEIKKQKRTVSMKLWTEFWEDQITKFNMHNEDQKEKGNRYAKPPEQLKNRAEELGIEILQPWKVKTAGSEELKELRKNKEEQAEAIKVLGEQVANLTRILENSLSKNNDAGKRDRPPGKG